MHSFLKFILGIKIYMFRTVPLSIIGVFHCTHSNDICHTGLLTACDQDQDGTAVPSWACSQAVNKPVRHIPLLCVQWKNSWWWTEELSETCRFSFQEYIWEISASSWFYYKKSDKMYCHRNVNFLWKVGMFVRECMASHKRANFNI